MKGGRIVFIYALALAVAVFAQMDRVESWLASRFDDQVPAALAQAESGARLANHALGVDACMLALDCATSGLFEGTYKKTYRCGDTVLAESRPGSPRAAREGEPSGSSVQDSTREAASAPKLVPPLDVLVVGDSLAVTLAVSMDKVFKEYDGLTMIPKGKIASGLFNPQYYDWEKALRQFLREYKPQVVVVMMGANDAKYLTLDPDSPEPAALADRRRSIYMARLEKFLAAMDEAGVKGYWIGLPVMGDQDLSGKGRALNALAREACQGSAGTTYVDIWDLLAGPDGAYTQHLLSPSGRRIRVREGDKLHFSTAGGEIIVRALLKQASTAVELKPREHQQVAQARENKATP